MRVVLVNTYDLGRQPFGVQNILLGARLLGMKARCIRQHPARLEVVQERRKRLIRDRTKASTQIDKIAAVRVPVDADVGDPVIGPEDGDDGDAGFDQSPGLQYRLTVDVHAVAVACGRIFLTEIKGCGDVR